MRTLPGWVAGALGVGALVGAFHLGGRVSATSPVDTATPAPMAAAAPTTAVAPLDDLALECEPGQRAVVRPSRDGGAPRVACVSDARPVARPIDTRDVPLVTAPAVVRVADTGARPYAQPAVITEPVDVYRPRPRAVRYETRTIERPRSVKKSVAIIGGSTAAGAVIGGLVKGGKGAVIGGLLGGGAATVWDQVTRRRDADLR